MTRVEEFEELRPLLFAIAYRILASVSEAEDAVQETWLRYAGSKTEPTSTKAFLPRWSPASPSTSSARRGFAGRSTSDMVPGATARRPLRRPGTGGRARRLGLDGGPAAA